MLTRFIISTEDDGIAAAARAAGCEAPFQRPHQLAGDEASIYDVLFHALDVLGQTFDYVVLLQATSPFRTGADIDACVSICVEMDAPACVAVTHATKPPEWMYTLDGAGRLHKIVATQGQRRQDFPRVVLPNGAVYVARPEWLRRTRNFIAEDTRAYVMPPERSVDIDSRMDMLLARALVAESSTSQRRSMP